MPLPIPPSEPRRRDQLEHCYEVEKELAERLRTAPKTERRRLYGEVYDEFFRRLPELPRPDPEGRRQEVALQAAALEPLLAGDAVFLELGAGDCALSLHLAAKVRRVIAVDASAEAVGAADRPGNFEVVVADATEPALAPGSVDLAYSCHFLEHLHPDDAADHLAAVLRLLRPGGRYVCVTPNRLWGPHDVSRHFDDAATGLHLHEYTHADLACRFRAAGFRRVEVLRGLARPPRRVAVWPYAWVERGLELLPRKLRRRLMNALLGRRRRSPFRPLEQVQMVGTKSSGACP